MFPIMYLYILRVSVYFWGDFMVSNWLFIVLINTLGLVSPNSWHKLLHSSLTSQKFKNFIYITELYHHAKKRNHKQEQGEVLSLKI